MSTRCCFNYLGILALILASAIAAEGQTSMPRIERLELVTDQAASGDGGNAWGGHQTRIVRTSYGLFTAYTVEGGGYTDREWRLAQRTEDGWHVIAEGRSGREPVNLLAGPTGRLYVISWPDGLPRIWTGTPRDGGFDFSDAAIPGSWSQGHWPYNAAGIDAQGNLCALQSSGDKPGQFRWAYYTAKEDQWTFKTTSIDYRHCYTYVVPLNDGRLSLVSTRDVQWKTLGYDQPEEAFDYVFNAFGYWHSSDVSGEPLEEGASFEAQPTQDFPYVFCNAQNDAYVDTRGRMHILYRINSEQTQGEEQRRHMVLEDGEVLKDVQIPSAAGAFCRIIQDTRGQFYLIGSNALLYPATSEDGTELGPPIELDLNGNRVEYSGMAIAAPRCGVPLADYVDGVFPSGEEKKWFYFRLRLSEQSVTYVEEQGRRNVPSAFFLSQNAPNPFNAATGISFSVPVPSHVKVAVYTVHGQLVRQLADQRYTPGVYHTLWDGMDSAHRPVSSGVYLYGMATDAGIIIKTMALVK